MSSEILGFIVIWFIVGSFYSVFVKWLDGLSYFRSALVGFGAATALAVLFGGLAYGVSLVLGA